MTSFDTPSPARPGGPAGLAAELERIYCAGSELTLGDLRRLLDAFSRLVDEAAPAAPGAAAVAGTVTALGLGHLSIGTVETLFDVASSAGPGDALAAVPLKQLEDLMGRIQGL
jgi:hypothetical protein